MAKLKDKWDGVTNFFEDNIKAWSIDYVNFNSNISIIVNEAWEDILEIEN